MKNILIICGKLADERTGGVQTRIINYSKNFSKFGINPIILSISDYKNQKKVNLSNVTVIKYPKNKLKIIFFSFLRNLVKVNNINGIHVLEIPTGIHQQLSLLYGKFFNLKTGVSFYGGEIWDAKNSGDINQNLKIKIAMNLASKIAVNSQATREFIPKKHNHKVHIVYPGANSELLKFKENNINHNTFNILYVGRLIRRKGLDDIIKAIGKVPKDYKVKLNIIGHGENNRILEYKKIINSCNLENQVSFIGEINNIKKIAHYYNDCDVLIMVPKIVEPTGGFESFGCVYLEAGLFEKPVIGTKHFGVKEAVVDKETGLLVNENSPKEISNAIIRLIKDKVLYKKLGENNYKRTIKYFMDNNSTEQLSKLFL